jgi:hypothetical protein
MPQDPNGPCQGVNIDDSAAPRAEASNATLTRFDYADEEVVVWKHSVVSPVSAATHRPSAGDLHLLRLGQVFEAP